MHKMKLHFGDGNVRRLLIQHRNTPGLSLAVAQTGKNKEEKINEEEEMKELRIKERRDK